MNYEPVLSQIFRQEEWEKSLNVLFSLGLDKNSASAKNKEGKTRVVYYFSPNSHEIRPILQIRTVKGEWTRGWNSSMKTFFDAKTAEMTEQDFWVAKSIRRYNNYYDDDVYDFTQQSIIELIGHPYIFFTKLPIFLLNLLRRNLK